MRSAIRRVGRCITTSSLNRVLSAAIRPPRASALPVTSPSSTSTSCSTRACSPSNTRGLRGDAVRVPADRPSCTRVRHASWPSACRSATTSWPDGFLPRPSRDAQRDGIPIDDALGVGLAHRWPRPRRASSATSRQATGPVSLRAAATDVLTACGYEPRDEGADITLVNCPFHALAQEYTDLVCGMNLELIGGLVESLEDPTLEARLAPTPGRCCVRLTDRTTVPPTR